MSTTVTTPSTPSTPSTHVIEIAREYVQAGLSIIPIRPDGSKAPSVAWEKFQQRLPTELELLQWFNDQTQGLAIIGGAVSGGLERLDFDEPELPADFEDLAETAGLWPLLETLPRVDTPAGGMHVYYRCPPNQENLKLARTAEHKTRIETKGEGGYTLAPGCPPECHPTGNLYLLRRGRLDHIPTLTTEQREALHDLARSFDQAPPPKRQPEPSPAPAKTPSPGNRPGDDYNERGDYEAVLEKHGWSRAFQKGEVLYWRRPGKTDPGISGHTRRGGREFFCFTSNGHPFEERAGYDPFSVYVLLEHGGNYKAATRQLGKEGFGEPPQKNTARSKPPAPAEPASAGQGNGGKGPAPAVETDETTDETWEEQVQRRAADAVQRRQAQHDQHQRTLADCIPQTGFLRLFVDLWTPTTEAPQVFHLAAGLATIATVLNRLVWLENGPHTVYPNLYMALIAESTWLRKSTALRESERFLRELGRAHGEEERYLLTIPQTINALGLWKDRPRGLVTHDEFGGWLAQADKLSYMAGVKAALTRAYDCPPTLEFLFKGKEERIKLEKPYLNLLVASTIDWLAEAVHQSDVGSGFMPRFLFIVAQPEDAGPSLPLPPRPDTGIMLQAQSMLANIENLLGQANLSQPAADLYVSWYNANLLRARSQGDDRMAGFRGRMADYVLKLAMLYNVSLDQSSQALYVTGESMAYAIDFAEYVVARAETMIREELNLGIDRALADRILRLLRKAGKSGMTAGEIYRGANSDKSHCEPALETLQEEARVEMVEGRSHSGRGRPGRVFFAVD